MQLLSDEMNWSTNNSLALNNNILFFVDDAKVSTYINIEIFYDVSADKLSKFWK